MYNSQPKKVVFVGDPGVGKTTLINYLIEKKYSAPQDSVAKGVWYKTINKAGKAIQLWDIPGDRTVPYYCKNAELFVYVADCSKSYEENCIALKKWRKEVNPFKREAVPVPELIVFTKSEYLSNEEDYVTLAREFGLDYVVCSPKIRDKVDVLENKLFNLIYGMTTELEVYEITTELAEETTPLPPVIPENPTEDDSNPNPLNISQEPALPPLKLDILLDVDDTLLIKIETDKGARYKLNHKLIEAIKEQIAYIKSKILLLNYGCDYSPIAGLAIFRKFMMWQRIQLSMVQFVLNMILIMKDMAAFPVLP